MSTLDGSSKEERLPVLVSGIGGTKLLGVPAISKAAPLEGGDAIAKAAVGLAKEWEAKESIVGMCFDTTNLNAGKIRKFVSLISLINYLLIIRPNKIL